MHIAGNFQGRKLSQIGEKVMIFTEKTIVTFTAPKDAMLPSFVEETFTNSHKTAKFMKVFSLASFPLYSIDG